MSKSYSDITRHVGKNLVTLNKSIPDTLQSFRDLGQSSMAEGALDKKQKELIALAIAVSQRCDACIGFHTKALIALGATKQEVAETLAVCAYMGGGPSVMYAADAMGAFEELSD